MRLESGMHSSEPTLEIYPTSVAAEGAAEVRIDELYKKRERCDLRMCIYNAVIRCHHEFAI